MALEAPPPELLPAAAAASGGRAGSSVISLGFLLVSVTLAVGGQLMLKAAMDDIGRIGTAEVANLGDTVLRAAKEPKLWTGLILFGVSALFWLVVLSRVDLSVAYPVVGLSYIVVVTAARFVFHENVPALRWLGVLVIAVGIALVGLSSRTATGA
ncbi:MAG TPA: EamA family transporter [Actinomycetota bacterium]|nr:EamA family transporter [Actinomycetota bacterium]